MASCKAMKDPEKEYVKQEEKMRKEAGKSYNSDVKKHYGMQSHGTKKMMHNTQKKADKYNSRKKR
jgi:hypothetical protein